MSQRDNDSSFWDIIDLEEMGLLRQKSKMELGRTCAWCKRTIGVDQRIYAVGASVSIDLSQFKGTFVLNSLYPSGKVIPAFVLPDAAPLKRKGWDLVYVACDENARSIWTRQLSYTEA